MALTLNVTPNNYQLSRNQIWAILITDNYVTTTGVKASLQINISNTGAIAGETITLPFNGKTIVLTFAASLTGDGKKLRVAGALTTAAFRTQIAEDIAKNYYINDSFDITVNGSGVLLTAKETGEEYSFLSPAEAATDITLGTNTAGVTEVVNENFMVALDVLMETTYKSDSYLKIHSQELKPIANTTIFELQDALHAYLEYDLPTFEQTTITRCNNILKRYKIRYAEKYGTDPEYKETTISDVCYVLKGALSHIENSYTTAYIDSHLIGSQKFNTWQPRIKKVTNHQQEYLYFLVPASTTSLKLKAKHYYTDGTTSTVTAKTKSGTVQYELYTIPAGYDQIITPSTGKTVWKYEVWIENQSDVVKSEVFTYILTSKASISDRYFMFENSVGVFDTFRATGTSIEGLKLENRVSQHIIENAYDYTKGIYEKHATSSQKPLTINTGWLTLEQTKWLEQLISSKRVYEIVSDKFVPVIIKTDSIVVDTSRLNARSFAFDYYHAFNNMAPQATLEPDLGGGGI